MLDESVEVGESGELAVSDPVNDPEMSFVLVGLTEADGVGLAVALSVELGESVEVGESVELAVNDPDKLLEKVQVGDELAVPVLVTIVSLREPVREVTVSDVDELCVSVGEPLLDSCVLEISRLADSPIIALTFVILQSWKIVLAVPVIPSFATTKFLLGCDMYESFIVTDRFEETDAKTKLRSK